MARTKKGDEKDQAEPEGRVEGGLAEPKEVAEAPKKAPEPGTVIKTYIQNGIRYHRTVQGDGSTLDIRG